MKKISYLVNIIIITFLLFTSCTKTNINPLTPAVPVIADLITAAATAISGTTAISGGNISSDGGAAISARGVCWNTSTGPTITNNKTTDGTGTGNFASSVTGLTGTTIYYIRAYATNNAGTAYGNEVSFTTGASLATVITTALSGITQTTATSGGNITNNGGTAITGRGVCWNTSSGPTTANSKTTDGAGTGIFASTVTGLTAGTIYYVRAYATNSAGTAYGNEIGLTTTAAPIPSVTVCSQVWMLKNLDVSTYRNGDPIPLVTDNTQWSLLTTGAYCYYQNNTANGPVYGKLYNWFAVNDPRGLAPVGWHVPTDAECTTLSTCVTGIGGNLKETGTTHWQLPNIGATNSSGWTGLPGGRRDDVGSFWSLGFNCSWWSSTLYLTTYGWNRSIYYDSNTIDRNNPRKQFGFSVRCDKD